MDTEKFSFLKPSPNLTLLNVFQPSKNSLFYLTFFMIFALASAVIIGRGYYIWGVLPLAVSLIALAFISLDKLLLVIAFFAPLSLTLTFLDIDIGLDLFLPTEPLLAIVLMLYLFKFAKGEHIDLNIYKHPVSISILVMLAWMLITAATSIDPLVSLKYFLVRLWFIVPFFFLSVYVFKDVRKIKYFSWAYIIPLIIVILYTIQSLLSFNILNSKISNMMSAPFYKDHTSYGAAIAMFIPILVGLYLNESKSLFRKIITLAVLLFFVIGLILSYTRAAWLSVVVAGGVYAMIYYRIKLRLVLSILGALVLLFFVFQTPIMMSLESNNHDSNTDLSQHLKSMSNISTDASNLERFNRWNCAIEMFKEKPILGWGPGTYQDYYAPFQLSKDKTIISTNFGNLGNAHSEYLGAMAEQGVLGVLLFVIVMGCIVYYGVRVAKYARTKALRTTATMALLALITYITHAFLNNFLDMDKIAIPFWGFTAVIVAIHIYHSDDPWILKNEPQD